MVGQVGLDARVTDGCRRRVANHRQTPNAAFAKRVHRCAPLGLMVVEPDYVEGFLPATLTPKRPRRSRAPKLRLQPITFDGSSNSLQHVTEPGAGRDSYKRNAESKRQREEACEDGGERIGDGSGGCGIGGSPHGTATCSPSHEILTYECLGPTALLSENHPVRSSPSAAMNIRNPAPPSLELMGGPKVVKDHEDMEMTSAILGSSSRGKQVTEGGITMAEVNGEGGKAPNGRIEGATHQRNTKDMREIRGGADIWFDGGVDAEEETKGENDPHIADGNDAGGCLAKWPASKTTKGARTMSMMTKQNFGDVVIPMALPGEAHQMDLRAVAKAVVLASGSSRFNVSRYARGKVLPSRVELPWRPPLKPPWRTKEGVTSEEQRPDLLGKGQAWQLYRHQQQQHWDLHHAALEIQRTWRGYLARAAFWTEGGIGLHAVATRIQRIFRGWRGKVRAMQALLEKRARAAAVITALGRGFQGRQEARRLRVNWHNAAAAKIQGHFRARAARRWMEQLNLAAAIRGATRGQAVWRGFAARRRFRVLHLDQSMEEKALKAICLDYTGRKGWTKNAQTTTPRLGSTSESFVGVSVLMPALPEGFAARSSRSHQNGLRKTYAICEGHNSRKESLMADGETAPSEASPAEDIAACKPTAGTVAGGVFGGAFLFPCQPQQILHPSPQGLPPRYSANVDGGVPTECEIAGRGYRGGGGPPDVDGSSGGGGDTAAAIDIPATPATPATPAALASSHVRDGPAVESHALPSDRYYVAYGHCLLVGAGSGVLDEAAEEAAAAGCSGGNGGPLTIKDFGGARARVRIRGKNRTRGYGDALEVFQEGLRRYPNSAALLYGASLAMQATWFTDGRGAAPTEAMLEASFCLLAQAWAQDPDRRAYQEVEAYFLAATRIARRRLLSAETAAAVAREAAEKRNAKELSAKGGAKDAGKGAKGGLTQRLAEGPGGERDQQSDDEQEEHKDKKMQEIRREEEEDEDEPEDVTVCRKAAAVATFHVALWSQIANGNHDMDLRRSETLAAYRRTGRLFSKAMQLDTSFELPEIKVSERVFSSFYRVRSRLLTTRPLRLKLPPHPDPPTPEKDESAGDETSTLRGLPGLPADPAARALQHQQQQRQQQQKEEQHQRQNLDEQHYQHLHQQDRQLQHHEQGQRQHQQGPEQQQHQTKQQQQLLKSILVDTPLGKILSPTSPKRPHVARRIANRVVTAVREGTKIILRISPRISPSSPRAAGLFMLEAARSDAGDKKSAYQLPEEQDMPQHPQQELGSGVLLDGLGQSAGSDGGGPQEAAVEGSASILPLSQAEDQPPEALAIRTRATLTDKDVAAAAKGTNPSMPKPVAAQFHQTSLRLSATAWRCGTKLVLRVNERRDADDIVGGTRAGDGGWSPPSGDVGPLSAATVKESEEAPPIKDGGTIGRATETSSPLGGGGSATIIVHEAEMERLLVAAVEEQVADGRPRDLVEAKEPFRMVSEHFIGKVVLLPEFDKDPRYKFSSSRSIRSRKGGFSVGLGHFSIALPHLHAMREQQAEKSARDDGARVLQRAFGGLLARSKCRLVCYDVLEAMEEIRQQGRRLLEEDILRQKESDAARYIQGAWKGWKLRIKLSELKSAAKVVQRCFRRLEAKRAAEKAERNRLEGPEVLTVYHKGTVISGVPLMLSVLRCGYSYKFVGRDQEACWAHHGYCYEFEVVKIVQHHNRRYAEGHRGDTFLTGRVGPIDPSRHRKIVQMLVSRLALVDALPAPTAELRGQHRYKTLVVQTTDLSLTVDSDHGSMPPAAPGAVEVCRPVRGDVISQRGLRGPGILAVGAEHGRGLRDTRALVAKSLKRYQKRQAKWEESRRRQAYMQHHQNIASQN